MPVPFDPYAMQGRDSAPICFRNAHPSRAKPGGAAWMRGAESCKRDAPVDGHASPGVSYPRGGPPRSSPLGLVEEDRAGSALAADARRKAGAAPRVLRGRDSASGLEPLSMRWFCRLSRSPPCSAARPQREN